MTLADFIDLVTRGGSTAVFLVIIWAFYTDRIVTRQTHQRVLDERDEYKAEWADALKLAGRAANVADKALKVEEHDSRLHAQRQIRRTERAEGDEQ